MTSMLISSAITFVSLYCVLWLVFNLEHLPFVSQDAAEGIGMMLMVMGIPAFVFVFGILWILLITIVYRKIPSR
jgi:hypothetical protein